MKRVMLILILVGLVGLATGCEKKTTTAGIAKIPAAQKVPKR